MLKPNQTTKTHLEMGFRTTSWAILERMKNLSKLLGLSTGCSRLVSAIGEKSFRFGAKSCRYCSHNVIDNSQGPRSRSRGNGASTAQPICCSKRISEYLWPKLTEI